MDPSKPESLKKKQVDKHQVMTHTHMHEHIHCVGRNQWKQSIAEMCYKQQQKASQ